MKAHQRIIRERRALCEEGFPADISKSDVRKIDIKTARSIILDYEWLGSMPAIVLCCYGIYFEENLGGVVVYSPEYSENLGVWDRYGYTGKMILISRGACVHWAHPHSASRLIRTSMKMLPSKYEIVTATVDQEAGEIGTIYQACGFHFVGQMSKGGKRISYVSNGVRKSGRQAQREFGSRGVGIAQMGAKDVKTHNRKQRYFAFIGTRSAKRTHLKAIEHLVKPYPKRDPEIRHRSRLQRVANQ